MTTHCTSAEIRILGNIVVRNRCQEFGEIIGCRNFVKQAGRATIMPSLKLLLTDVLANLVHFFAQQRLEQVVRDISPSSRMPVG